MFYHQSSQQYMSGTARQPLFSVILYSSIYLRLSTDVPCRDGQGSHSISETKFPDFLWLCLALYPDPSEVQVLQFAAIGNVESIFKNRFGF